MSNNYRSLKSCCDTSQLSSIRAGEIPLVYPILNGINDRSTEKAWSAAAKLAAIANKCGNFSCFWGRKNKNYMILSRGRGEMVVMNKSAKQKRQALVEHNAVMSSHYRFVCHITYLFDDKRTTNVNLIAEFHFWMNAAPVHFFKWANSAHLFNEESSIKGCPERAERSISFPSFWCSIMPLILHHPFLALSPHRAG